MKPYNMAIISVFIAVLALSAVSLISMAGKTEINSELDGVGLNGMSVSVYDTYNENVTDLKVYDALAECEDISKLTPVLYDYAEIIFSRTQPLSTLCWGISPQAKDIVNLDLLYGRMLKDNDIQSKNFVCLVDENVATTAYGRANIVGKKVYISMGSGVYPFEIIGIIRKTSNVLNGLSGDVIPNFIYVPYTVMENMTSKKNIDQIFVDVNTDTVTDEDIFDYLIEKITFFSPVTLKISNLSQQRESINKIVDVAFLALFAVSCVAVIVCSISVATSVNTAVSIQRHDIGIKLSLGASKFDIMTEFLTYSISACLIGITVGILSGSGLNIIINLLFHTKYSFDIRLLLWGISVTILLTTVFSLYPSYQAAKLTPVKALNRE